MTITVRTTPKNRISINNQQTGRIKTTLGTGGGGAGGIDTLVELRDVDATDVDPGETLVYDAASGKFKVEVLPGLDGGTF